MNASPGCVMGKETSLFLHVLPRRIWSDQVVWRSIIAAISVVSWCRLVVLMPKKTLTSQNVGKKCELLRRCPSVTTSRKRTTCFNATQSFQPPDLVWSWTRQHQDTVEPQSVASVAWLRQKARETNRSSLPPSVTDLVLRSTEVRTLTQIAKPLFGCKRHRTQRRPQQ